MGLFKRKNKKPQDGQQIGQAAVFRSTTNVFSDFGGNINDSDVVKVCIDRIASHSAKLKPRHVKTQDDSSVVEKGGGLSYILKYQPNEYQTTYDFIYRVVTLLFLNNNAFIYPMYDPATLELTGLYPLRPSTVEAIKDSSGALFLRLYFDSGKSYTLPYESLIHLRRFYGTNDIFGGTGAISDHKAILKTVAINDSILQGIDNAVKSSFQIKGLLKINGMLSDKDKAKQKEAFDEALKESYQTQGSSVVPIDLKADYVPLTVDPKLVDAPTLTFLQKKIISYFGVSEPIFDNKYGEADFNAFYEGTIEGVAIAMSEAFSKALLTKGQLLRGEQIVFYSERLQYASWQTKVAAIEKLMGLGILSLNESRGLLGLEPVDGGDKRLQSLNYVDSTVASKYQVGEEPKEGNKDGEGNEN